MPELTNVIVAINDLNEKTLEIKNPDLVKIKIKDLPDKMPTLI